MKHNDHFFEQYSNNVIHLEYENNFVTFMKSTNWFHDSVAGL